MAQSATMSLDALRERIRELEGNRVTQQRRPSEVGSLDRLVHGLPSPGILEITGAVGSGRLRMAVAIAVQAGRTHRSVAWVDPRRRVYPPALASSGIALDRTVFVRPAGDREAWAVEQVARSGCFPLVIVVDPSTRGRLGARWGHAVEQGACTLIVIDERPAREVSACVRLGVTKGRVVVLRDRNGIPGGSTELPPWPEGVGPWGD